MEKIYVGKLTMAHRVSNTAVTEKTELRFENGELHFDDPFKLRQEYYVVEKSEVDAYMARKEDLEKINHTPVYGENQRLRAKVEALRFDNVDLSKRTAHYKTVIDRFQAKNNELMEINRALGEENSKLTEKNEALKDTVGRFYGMTSAEEELLAANEKLAAENSDLKEKIKELGVIKSFLEVGNEKWIRQNTELKWRNKALELENAKLRGELSRADDELAKYCGVQEVVDIQTTRNNESYVVWWAGRNGDEHKLELKLVQ